MKEDTRFDSTSDCDTLGLGEKKPIFNICEVCGEPLCSHGICWNAELEYVCRLCFPYGMVMDAMKHVSVVSGPAMDGKQYRAFMDAMKIFSQATKEIWGDGR